MKVIVSNPFKLYAHQLSFALQKAGNLLYFITSVWYSPQSFNKKFGFLPGPIKNKLAFNFKRSFDQLKEEKVITYPIPELLRQLLVLGGFVEERWFFYVERIHDRMVARKLGRLQADVVIGYEKASLNTFKKAKKLGMTTILDLAQVHYRHIEEMHIKYGILKGLVDSESLLRKINKIKEEEYQYSDYILVLSHYAKQTLVKEGIPEAKIKVASLGFDPAKFKPKSTYRTGGRFRLIFVGSIMRRKGIELLLEAFKELALPEAELVIVGPMGDAVDIMERYKGSFTYIPYLHHDELVSQYQEADLFVFPSYLDSWAMVVLEAMACGTPVIVTEQTGACEAVQKGGGAVIPIHNLEAIKEKILFYYNDRKQLETDGIQAYKIAQEYTWEAYHQKVVNNILETQTQNAELKAHLIISV